MRVDVIGTDCPELEQYKKINRSWLLITKLPIPSNTEADRLINSYNLSPSPLHVSRPKFDYTEAVSIMKSAGKNETIIYNAMIKWVYWSDCIFNENKDVIVDMQRISLQELLMLYTYANAGHKVVVISREGIDKVTCVDPYGKLTNPVGGQGRPIPTEFRIRYEGDNIMPTNTWVSGDDWREYHVPPIERHGNVFFCVRGVDNPNTFPAQLYDEVKWLKDCGRPYVLCDKPFVPSPAQLQSINRKSNNHVDLINDVFGTYSEIVRDLVLDWLDANSDMHAGRKTESILKMAYSLATYRHLQDTGIYMQIGEPDFWLKLLSALNVDIICFTPDNKNAVSESPILDFHFDYKMKIKEFPKEKPFMQVTTIAKNAEGEIQQMLYTKGSGIYKEHQFDDAETVALNCTVDEITQLWRVPFKLRQGFTDQCDPIQIPVLHTMLNGVPEGNIGAYNKFWKDLKADLVLINPPDNGYQFQVFYAEATSYGKFDIDRIKTYPWYTYGLFQERVTIHIVKALQRFFDDKIIAGIGKNSIENIITTVAFNLPRDLLMRMQNQDFTGVPLTAILLWTQNCEIPISTVILMEFLSYLGFDVLYLNPTGLRITGNRLRVNNILNLDYGKSVTNLDPSAKKEKKGFFGWLQKL